MTRRVQSLFFLFAALAGIVVFLAGQDSQQGTIATPAIRASTRLVLVDTVVANAQGQPVLDLKPNDFTVEENGKKQKIASVSLEQRGTAQQWTPPQLPGNMYSNRAGTLMPPGALTVILIDALNTPAENQAYARQQLLQYVKRQITRDERVAVFALGTSLSRLQDFTTSPEMLRVALESYVPQPNLPGKASPVTMNIPTRLKPVDDSQQAVVLSATQQFAQQQTSYVTQARINGTLEAMRTLGRLLAGHPGRKNVIWISAGFPFSLMPQERQLGAAELAEALPSQDPMLGRRSTGSYAGQVERSYDERIRRTFNLLSDAKIAIYPVDARGLMNIASVSATETGRNTSGRLIAADQYAEQVSGSLTSITDSQQTMSDIARQTGGRAFFNRNDIDHAVALAMADGGTYYALSYYPEKKNFDGGFRSIKVTVSRPGVSVRHRSGYFAIDPAKGNRKDRDAETLNVVRDQAAQATMINFDARVVAAQGASKYTVQFLVDPATFTAEQSGDKRHIDLDFYVVALARDGKPAADVRNTVDTLLTAEQYGQVQSQGLLVPVEVQIPAGDFVLRLAVRDNRTGYIGSVNGALPRQP